MTPPRPVEEWAESCVMATKVLCADCVRRYAAEQVAQARAEERKRAVGYLQVLQANHPHLHDAYRHAELNLQAVLETDWQPITAALRART